MEQGKRSAQEWGEASMTGRLVMLAILIALISLLLLSIGSNCASSENITRVGIFTDSHIKTNTNTLEIVVEKLNDIELDFVIELGDAVDGNCSKLVLLKQYKRFDEAYSQLQHPRYYVFGNHECAYAEFHTFHNTSTDDYHNPTQAIQFWLEHTGAVKDYYSFDLKGIHFVVINNALWNLSSPIAPNFGERNHLDWLKADLASSNLPTYIFSHRPINIDTPPSEHDRETEAAVCADPDVMAVISGHLDYFALLTHLGVTFLSLNDLKDNGTFYILTIYSNGNFQLVERPKVR